MARFSSKQMDEMHRSELELRLHQYYLDLYEDPNYVAPTDYGEYIDMCIDQEFTDLLGQGI